MTWQRRQRAAFESRMADTGSSPVCRCGALMNEHDYAGEPFIGPLACKRTGCADFRLPAKCVQCQGLKTIPTGWVDVPGQRAVPTREETCPLCHGTGEDLPIGVDLSALGVPR